MRETLIVYLSGDDTGECRYLLLNGAGEPAGEVNTGTLSQAAGQAAARRVIVLVPGSEVLLAQVRVPGTNRQKVLRAIPYALEEQVAEDVEALHFASGPDLGDGVYPVVVVAREQMDLWRGHLQEAGLSADLMIPDFLALPQRESVWTILKTGEHFLVRSAGYHGFAADSGTLEVLLEGTETAPGEQDQQIRLLVSDGEAAPRDILDREGLVTDLENYHGDPLEVLAAGFQTNPGIDLLQGPYSRTEELGRLWRPWRATAAMLLGGVLIWAASRGLAYYQLSNEKTMLSEEINQVFRQTFPEIRKVVNPRVQMQQELEKLQRGKGVGNDQFLSLVADAGRILRGTKGVDVSAASYRLGYLDVDLTASDLQVLDQLKQALMAAGTLEVEIQSASANADKKVQSRLRIRGKV